MKATINGFGLSGYRSFGHELQRIGPCLKINLLIGQNNSGKSNILRFLCDRYSQLAHLPAGNEWKLQDLELFRSPETFHRETRPALAVAVEIGWLPRNPADLVRSLRRGLHGGYGDFRRRRLVWRRIEGAGAP